MISNPPPSPFIKGGEPERKEPLIKRESVLEPISKLGFYSFCVIPGLTRNPATLPFLQ